MMGLKVEKRSTELAGDLSIYCDILMPCKVDYVLDYSCIIPNPADLTVRSADFVYFC
jgi:hypothetical protein